MDIEENEMDESPNRRSWTNEEIGAIINAVHQRPFLYDKRNVDYKQNSKKDQAWEEIAASLPNKKLTARECKRKWNTLRIQKRRIINQQGKKKGKHQVQWLFFDTLNFLMPHMEWPSSRDGTIKKDPSDVEYDENSCNDGYDNFQTSFSIKKQQDDIDEDIHEDETIEHCSEGEEHLVVGQDEIVHEQQEQQQRHGDPLILPYHEIQHDNSSASPSSTAADIIRLIHPPQQVSKGSQVFMTPVTTTQHHQQQHHQQQPQQQQQHHSQQQQLISIAHPVTMARYEAHQATVDSTGVVSNAAVECPMTPTNTSHSSVSAAAVPSSSNHRLNYFLMDIQQQMEKLSEIEKMELKVDMQKLLLDKLRNSLQANRCE